MSDNECQNTPDNFYGGKIAQNYEAWSALSTDSWITQTVLGELSDLADLEVHGNLPYTLTLPKADQIALNDALQEYFELHIIEQCEDTAGSFYSTLFPRYKRDGTVRVIFNLKTFNSLYIEHIHFKMDTLRDALLLVTPTCYFASIDFKHAYFSVPIAEHYRHMFRFRWHDQTYQFTCLPQGFAPAPRIFTKLLKPVLSHMRSRGIQIICYIDDCLLIADCPVLLAQHVAYAVEMFDSLGLTIHPSKSVLTPTQCIEFLGFQLDSTTMFTCLTSRKQEKIANLASSLLAQDKITIRDLASMIGNLVAADPGVNLGPLHYKTLEIEKNLQLTYHKGNFEGSFRLSADARATLKWWINELPNLKRTISVGDIDHEIFTDASQIGWGARMGKRKAGGHWAATEMAHINELELKASFLAVKAFFKNSNDIHVKVRSDNSTTVACINKAGSTKPALMSLTHEFLTWTSERNITVSAVHIPGVDNIDADKESRKTNTDTEWMLKPHIFSALCQTMHFMPNIDMFATRLNKQIPTYVAWNFDPDAIDVDAFSMNWHNLKMYCFPPFSVVGRMLQKLQQTSSTALVILPLWPTRPWFVRALDMLVKEPKLLPKRCLILPQKPLRQHPLERKLTLTAMMLSGRVSDTKAYRRKLRPFSSGPGETAPTVNIGTIYRNGCSFVSKGKVVFFSQL